MATSADDIVDGDDASADGDNDCPLCLEPFDATDRELESCQCGYRICVLCRHVIQELADTRTGRCPNCRTPFAALKPPTQTAIANAMTRQTAVTNRTRERRARAAAETAATNSTAATSMLTAEMRVLQRNLVYIVGLPGTLARDDILRDKRYYGKYGKIIKISLTRRPTSVVRARTGTNDDVSLFGAYITYKLTSSAAMAIACTHGTTINGAHTIRVTYGTTKHCSHFLRGLSCNTSTCTYLHQQARPEDCVTKDELVAQKNETIILNERPFPLSTTAPSQPPTSTPPSRTSTERQHGTPTKSHDTTDASQAQMSSRPTGSVWSSNSAPASTLFASAAKPSISTQPQPLPPQRATSSSSQRSSSPTSSPSTSPLASPITSAAINPAPHNNATDAKSAIIRIVPSWMPNAAQTHAILSDIHAARTQPTVNTSPTSTVIFNSVESPPGLTLTDSVTATSSSSFVALMDRPLVYADWKAPACCDWSNHHPITDFDILLHSPHFDVRGFAAALQVTDDPQWKWILRVDDIASWQPLPPDPTRLHPIITRFAPNDNTNAHDGAVNGVSLPLRSASTAASLPASLPSSLSPVISSAKQGTRASATSVPRPLVQVHGQLPQPQSTLLSRHSSASTTAVSQLSAVPRAR